MFSRTHFIIFTLIFIAFGYLFYLNPGEVEFLLYEDRTLSISPALIAFGAFIIGAFFVFLVTLFVDARRAFELWRSSKTERKEGKIRERYSDALEEMLRGQYPTGQRDALQHHGEAAPAPGGLHLPGQPLFPGGKIRRGHRGPGPGPKPSTRKTWSFFSTW